MASTLHLNIKQNRPEIPVQQVRFCSPCFYLSFDAAPPLCHLIGSLLVPLQLGAPVRVESAELSRRLFSLIQLTLQVLEQVFVLGDLCLPPLGEIQPLTSG